MKESLITQSVWPSTRQLLADHYSGEMIWPGVKFRNATAWGATMRQGRAWAAVYDARYNISAPGSAADVHRTILRGSK